MRKIPGLFGSLAILALLAGCTSTVWLKSNVSVKQANADLSSCTDVSGFLYIQASADKKINGSVLRGSDLEREDFDKCMMGKGYKMEK